MTDDPTPFPARWAPTDYRAFLLRDRYADTTVTYRVAHTPAEIARAHVGQFEDADGAAFALPWLSCTIEIADIPTGRVTIVAVPELGPDVGAQYLIATDATTRALRLDDARRLIERAGDLQALNRRGVRLPVARGRPRAVTPETAPLWAADIRDAVAQCHARGERVTYQTAGRQMQPFPLSPSQFGEHVRKLAALGYRPWPTFFERPPTP